jgi:tellurite methyltransferase
LRETTSWKECLLTTTVDRIRWNRKYSDASFHPDWAPDVVLAQRLPELPRGRALDLACGVGANSLFLAKRGYSVDALDLSDVAIERLRVAADAEGVSDRLRLMVGDAATHALEPETYDLVVCFRFLQREMAPRLVEALKPGGVLLFQTFTRDYLKYRPEFREEFCLASGELPGLFGALESLFYEEVDTHEAAYATLVARKR